MEKMSILSYVPDIISYIEDHNYMTARLGVGVLHRNRLVGFHVNVHNKHAEQRFIRTYRRKYCYFRGPIRIIVVRILKTGELACSKPCALCSRILRQTHVDRIYWVNEEGRFEWCYAKHMKNDQISSATRRRMMDGYIK